MLCQNCKSCLGFTTVNLSGCCVAKEGEQIVECEIKGLIEPIWDCGDFDKD